LEGRWATLAVRAQRTGVLDYRTYEQADSKWLLKEQLLLNDIENSVMAEHCRVLLPILDPDQRLDLFDQILGYELPWLLKGITEGNSADHLIAQYKDAMEKKHGRRRKEA